MTEVYRLPNTVDASAESAQWLAKLDRGLTVEEETELRAWLSESRGNRSQFLAMARMWDNMNSLSWLADFCEEPAAPRNGYWPIAATVLVAFGVALAAAWQWMGSSGADGAQPSQVPIADLPPVVYETAIGEQSTVRLVDGSEIILNTNSQVHVRLTEHHRLLTLLHGEAHVTVASDPTRPLSLTVGDKIFQALGTAFSVEVLSDEGIELVVTEGTVLVGSRPQPASPEAPVITPILPTSSTSVDAGEELRITSQGATKTSVAPEEIAARLSWRQGNLIFVDEPLEDAIREVSKYTTVRFVFLDEAIKSELIGGRYKAGDIETLLLVLRENVGVAHERTDDNQILLSKQP